MKKKMKVLCAASCLILVSHFRTLYLVPLVRTWCLLLDKEADISCLVYKYTPALFGPTWTVDSFCWMPFNFKWFLKILLPNPRAIIRFTSRAFAVLIQSMTWAAHRWLCVHVYWNPLSLKSYLFCSPAWNLWKIRVLLHFWNPAQSLHRSLIATTDHYWNSRHL